MNQNTSVVDEKILGYCCIFLKQKSFNLSLFFKIFEILTLVNLTIFLIEFIKSFNDISSLSKSII